MPHDAPRKLSETTPQGESMSGMGNHSKESMTADQPRRDHLWVLVIVAACALLEVWASWVTIGSMSGFPKIGRLSTDWTLAVTTELYWGYALYAWLAVAPGPRSRRFAMWSAAAVFTLSLTGQGAAHLVPPGAKPSPILVVFVTALPVIVLALIAVLIHLRQLDREEAVEVAEENALRAELAAAVAARETAEAEPEALRAELETARAELARTVAKAEALARKLAGNGGRKRGGSPGRNRARKPAGTTAGNGQPATAPEDTPDVDREALVLKYLADGKSASEAGRLAGLSDSRGRQIARELAKAAPQGPDSKETS